VTSSLLAGDAVAVAVEAVRVGTDHPEAADADVGAIEVVPDDGDARPGVVGVAPGRRCGSRCGTGGRWRRGRGRSVGATAGARSVSELGPRAAT
jgi:hypothetical protein